MDATNEGPCTWPGQDALMRCYHDEEWGVPVHDDRLWFEYMVLDAFQAGLSWRTVLHKRETLRRVFHGFEPGRVAAMTPSELEHARTNPAIIRNRLKIQAAVRNAEAFLNLQARHGSFDAYIWSFTAGHTITNHWRSMSDVPAATPLSDEVSRALRAAGFSFVGSTICYAFLQAGGVVNDHLVGCPRHDEVAVRGRATHGDASGAARPRHR
ncbi:MAG: DNA-3-methyladenine glycosylase I [Gammaproteobacteria bacterium]|nr:DNA-3-methyladenine glycosylase I [Gammaproteobacteria bacterium]